MKTIIYSLITVVVALMGSTVSTAAPGERLFYVRSSGAQKVLWQHWQERESVVSAKVGSIDVSPDGYNVLYAKLHRSGGHIVLLKDGERRHFAVPSGSSDQLPQWQPDGDGFSFVRDNKLLMLKSLKSKGVQVLYRATAPILASSWSPNGQSIVIEIDHGSRRELRVVERGQNTSRHLTWLSDDIASNVSWSPQGTKILYADSATETYTIWPDGSRRVVLTDGESHHAIWSPDGTRVAFIEGQTQQSIAIREADDSVSDLPIGGEPIKIAQLAWSRDGRRLAYSVETGKRGGIYVTALTAGSPSQRIVGQPVTSFAW